MKNLILLGLLALSLVSLGSCAKLTKCDCPAGQSLSVNGNDEYEIRANCEAKSGGSCTY
ncbi:MAG: hypothetical protein JST82_07895 [Bacteroidetes bacterium]|nr:hypothetical protein [Bacteroidota bacterium]